MTACHHPLFPHLGCIDGCPSLFFSHTFGAWSMLGAHGSCLRCPMYFPARNACFFVFLGVCFYIRCFGTWEHNSSLCNVFRDLLNLHSWSLQSLHKSSNVLFCWLAWFLRELHQNSLELLCFGKSRITWLKYRKHYKISQTNRQLF